MRVAVTVKDRAAGVPRDVLVDADPVDSVANLRNLLEPDQTGSEARPEQRSDLFLAGRAVAPELSLRSAGLVDGVVIEIGRTDGPASAPGPGLLEVSTVTGPGDGGSRRLGVGRHTIGSDPGCDVRVHGEGTGRLMAEVQVDVDLHVKVRALSEQNPPRLGGVVVGGEFIGWPGDQQLLCGPSQLELRTTAEPDAALEAPEEGGWVCFNRPPRFVPPLGATTFKIPARPQPGQRNPWPWLTALLPAVFGVGMAIVFHSKLFLAFAFLTPLMALGNAASARRQGKRSARQLTLDHDGKVSRIEADIAASRAAERLALRAGAPSAAELWNIATGPQARLWERRPTDLDYLRLRVGTADLPSTVVVEDLREDIEHRRQLPAPLHDVPASFSLSEAGVVGVAGPDTWPSAVGRWLVGQLAVLHSPQDVTLYVLTDAQGRDAWQWTRWLPHLRPTLGQDCRVLVGIDAETVGRRLAELIQLVTDRQAQAHESRSRGGPDVVVVMDGARRLRTYPGVLGLLRDGPAVGVYSICLSEDERTLPEECQAVVARRVDDRIVLRLRASDPVRHVRPDTVDEGWFDGVSRALAPLRDTGDEEGAAIPTSARLLEVLDLDPPTPEVICGRWAQAPRSTRAVVGVSLDGAFAVDLVRDGPHGLIAGTTGSGKSELLQTLVASLAAANRPDHMNFVLVDYKGGAAFKDCVRLPHTVGMVTDLDAHLVERALTSLSAELTRRERLLSAAGAKDLEDYLEVRVRQSGLDPMPRLLIVIDEFASMARELPDFVTGLVNIAQRGRSLGIHLLLATQRPSGVVSAEIRANTNLRVALRVTDSADSSDVIGAADAARIPGAVPGRAYVRLGHLTLVPFQTARVGGRSPQAAPDGPAAPFLAELSWGSAGQPCPAAPRATGSDNEVTDLSTLVDAVDRASTGLALPPRHSPWLPALPRTVLHADLVESLPRGAAAGDTAALPRVPWALMDLPAEQAQPPVYVDFAELGHLFVVGAPRSGRSQTLRTLAAAMAAAVSSADVHLFALDCGNGALLPLADLPHTGAVVLRTEKERLVRLFDRLQAELSRRQDLLGQLGVADITEQRQSAASGDRLPHLVLLLDRWEGFVSSFGEQDAGALVEQVLGFLREGASAGLHVLLAGDRSLLSGRISVLTEDKWVLRLAERSDYGMAGLNPRTVVGHMPPGRVVRAAAGHQAQIALLAPEANGSAQVDALAAIARAAHDRDRDVPVERRPMRIDTLPTTLTYEDAAGGYLTQTHDPRMWALIGVGGEQLTATGTDLGSGPPSFLVAGPARSGRTNLLAVMTRSLLEAGCEVVLLCPRRSPLQDLFAREQGLRACLTGTEVDQQTLEPLLAPDDQRVVLVVDDGELLRDVACKDYLRGYLRGASGTNRALVLGGNVADVGGGFSGWQTDVRNYQRGALLSPRNIFDGDLIGVRVPRSLVSAPVAAGRALIHLGDGVLSTVQVPRVVP